MTPFPCPKCHRMVRTSTLYRRLLYACCYGIPAVLVAMLNASIWIRAALWIVLAFLFAFLFTLLSFLSAPSLVLANDKEEDSIQTLHLSDKG